MSPLPSAHTHPPSHLHRLQAPQAYRQRPASPLACHQDCAGAIQPGCCRAISFPSTTLLERSGGTRLSSWFRPPAGLPAGHPGAALVQTCASGPNGPLLQDRARTRGNPPPQHKTHASWTWRQRQRLDIARTHGSQLIFHLLTRWNSPCTHVYMSDRIPTIKLPVI